MATQTSIKCGICLETAHEEEKDTWSVLLTCGHVFHSNCLELALQSQQPSVCPFCRDLPQLWKDSRNKGRGISHKPIFLPLDCQAHCRSPEAPTPGAHTPSSRPRISAEDFNSQVRKAEDLRAELSEVRAELKEVSQSLENAEEELEDAQMQLRKAEAAQEEQQQSFEDAKAALKEEVATRQRELQKLRQEKHDLKAQFEAKVNSLRSQKAREEKAKLECQHRLAQQDLLLRKDLGAAGLSELYKRLSAASQEGSKPMDAAHADAMNMRNKQYQKLHGDYQKLSADFAAKRQLASRQAAQLLQLQGEVSRLTKRLQERTEPQSETPSGLHGRSPLIPARSSGIPYDTPPEELMPVRLACSPSLPAASAMQTRTALSADAAPRATLKGGTQQECMVVLDGTEAPDAIAASAAAFAQQLLTSKARAQVQQGISSEQAPHRQTNGSEQHPSSPGRQEPGHMLQRVSQVRGSRGESDEDREPGSLSDDDLAAFVIGESDDDLELDRDEEGQLLSKFEETAVDVGALPQSLLSPPSDSQVAKEDFSREKENRALQCPSADLLHNSAASLRSRAQAGTRASEAPFRQSSRQGGYPGRPGGSQQGRKQLRRLYDSSSMQVQQQPPHAAADRGDTSDEDAVLLVNSFAGTSQSREAMGDLLPEKQLNLSAERPVSLKCDGGSADDVSLTEEPTSSKQAVRSSMRPPANSQRASAARDKLPQTGWRFFGSPRPDQDSNDSWESSLPGSTGPSGQMRSASPDASQQRPCGQVVLPSSSRFASDVSCIGFTPGTGSFVGGRLPSMGGGTYVRTGADGRGGTLKMLTPGLKPKLKRQAPLSFGGRTSGKLASGSKKGRGNAAHGALPVTAYFR